MAEKQQPQLTEVLKHFSTAMLVTHDQEGFLRARPMQLAQVDDNGDIWFVTWSPTGKVEEMRRDARVVATLQGHGRFAYVSGTAELQRDHRRIEELWSDTWSIWFPKGLDDPDLTLIRLQAHSAETWDLTTGEALKYLWEATKAVVQGQEISNPPGEVHQSHTEL